MKDCAGFTMENIRNSVPGYVPCVEAADAKFREAYKIDMSSVDIIVEPGTVAPYPRDNTQVYTTNKSDKSQWKPNDYMELSVVACLCNFVFGLAAMSLSFKSRSQWASSDTTGAKCYGVVSMIVSVLAIVSTPVIIFVCLWYLLPRDTVQI